VGQRTISSIGVVLIGLIPAWFGGWVFAVVFTGITAIAFREAIAITNPLPTLLKHLGLTLVVLAGVLAALNSDPQVFALVVALCVGAPLAAAMFLSEADGIETWTSTTSTALYLALPAHAAIDLRNAIDYPAHVWMKELAGVFPGVADASGGGLAWLLLAVLVTWLSDTFSYLVGKTWGQRKLLPRVSPNKTVEGALGGLVAAAFTAVACDVAFGMEVGVANAIGIGIVLGVVGQVGDLSESMLKRMRGVKDSGTFVPGHGGVLDRIDALIFVVVAAWLIAPLAT
jgi:phosphatidate cytidylyltransferase